MTATIKQQFHFNMNKKFGKFSAYIHCNKKTLYEVNYEG